jgi:hypothetical protein
MSSHYYKIAKAAAFAVGAAVTAIFSFQVREFAAAFLIFALLFGAAEAVLLGLVLMQEAALSGMTEVEARLARVRVRHSHSSTADHLGQR